MFLVLKIFVAQFLLGPSFLFEMYGGIISASKLEGEYKDGEPDELLVEGRET